MQKNLVALMGRKQSGKSTIAGHLLFKHDYHVSSLAAPIREMLSAFIGLQASYLCEEEWKAREMQELCGKTNRYALQTLGTDWGRKLIGEDVWLRYWEYTHEPFIHNNKPLVVDDVRFTNEAERIVELGGIVIWIDPEDRIAKDDFHESETNLPTDLATYRVSTRHPDSSLAKAEIDRIIGVV